MSAPQPQEAPHTQFKFSGDPVSRSFDTLRTPRQLSALSMIDRYTRIDVDAECMALLGCKPEDLTKRAASALIDWLKSDGFQSAVRKEVA